jgi:putative transposase
VRRTRRALVEWLGNSYFAPELEALDGTDVIVGYDIRDASRVLVRAIDEVDGERAPGRLIAEAIFEGHKTRYVPLSAERAALEKRQKARLARVALKADGIRRELEPGVLIDLSTRQPAPFGASAPVEAAAVSRAPVAAAPASPTVAILPGGRPHFRDDVSFAAWLAENPGEATASDVALLVELITHHSMQELLRMHGIDLEALRSIARSRRHTGAA